MSQSPTQAGEATKDYLEGWGATYELMRQGMSWSGHERHNGFLNLGAGRFADISAVAGLDLDDDGRGLAIVDWDQDGALDFWASNRTGPALRFFRNRDLSGSASVSLSLQGTSANRDAIGARVELIPRDTIERRLVRIVTAGDAFLSQSSKRLHFGLGGIREIDKVVVRWPGGDREEFDSLEPGRSYRLVQGTGRVTEVGRVAQVLPDSSAPVEAQSPSQAGRTVLASRIPLSGLDYIDPAGLDKALPTGAGRPVLINLWASWCENCRHELVEMVRERRRISRQDLDVYALSVDDAEDRDEAAEFLAEIGWPFASGFAGTDLVDILDIVQQTVHDLGGGMVLPTSFLIDAEGGLAALYRGPVGVDSLLVDLAADAGSPERIRAAATPFTGRWISRPAGRGLEDLANLLRSHGHTEIAARYLLDLELSEQAPRWAVEKWATSQFEIGRDLADLGRHESAVTAFGKALEKAPERWDIHNDMGHSLMEMERYPEAQGHFAEAVRLAPTRPRPRLNLALSLVNQQEVAAGVQELQKTLEIAAPDDETRPIALFNLSVFHGESGDIERALELAGESLALDPGSFEANRYLGVLEQRRGRPDAAIAAFLHAQEVDPSDGLTCLLLGRSYLQAGDLAGADLQLEMLRAMGHPAAPQLAGEIARIRG